MMKTRLLALSLLAFAVSAFAEVVSPETAAQAVRTWARRGGHFRGRMGKDVERTVRHETDGGFFYAVKMKGGGTVFTSGDDENEPIIAFTTEDSDFSKIDRGSPLWALLNGDARGRRRAPSRHRRTWRRLALENAAGSDEPVAFAAAGASPARTAISDLRVDALVKSKWNQGGGIWNYYTPVINGKHCPCGCVATAAAQIMRYLHGPVSDGGLGIPLAAVPQITAPCELNMGGDVYVKTNMTTQGGTYAWDGMPLTQGLVTTEAQKQNIGKLTSDVGISVMMDYGETASGTGGWFVPGRLINDFGYRQALYYNKPSLTGDNDDNVLHGALFANFDAGRPCQIGIPSHSIVADGYGYEDGVPYVHLNMGWSGQHDLWYNLPDMTSAGSGFNTVDGIDYNIFPEIGGVTESGMTTHAIISGRVLSHDGVPFKGGTVKVKTSGTSEVVATVTSSATGVWAAILPAGTYDLLAEAADGVVTAEKTGVELTVPTSRISSDPGHSPRVESGTWPGNSWGNDLVLSEVVVKSAVWTGNGDRMNPSDPLNWSCTDAEGHVLGGFLPTEDTSVIVGASTTFCWPAGRTIPVAEIVFADEVTLADDCDWSGFEGSLDSIVDLDGHGLVLSTLAGKGTVTGAGELHLSVPAGESVADAGVTLSGALKLVKEGSGTYVASRTGQSYAGGTVILAGLCETPAGTGHSPDPATNERYLGQVDSEVLVDAGGSLYIRGDYNHKVYSIVSRGGAVRIESMADEGSPILLEASPETSMSWHTLTAAKNQTVTWEWPERALSARLTVKVSDGKTVSEVLTDRSVCSYAFNPALPDSAAAERTYTLQLDFFATLDATGTPIAGESLTAENIGVVRGVDGAAGDLIGKGTEDRKWDDAYGRSVVLPIPAGSTSLSVNGEPVEPAPDGSFGWRAIYPIIDKELYSLVLEGAESAEITLTGHDTKPMLLIVR